MTPYELVMVLFVLLTLHWQVMSKPWAMAGLKGLKLFCRTKPLIWLPLLYWNVKVVARVVPATSVLSSSKVQGVRAGMLFKVSKPVSNSTPAGLARQRNRKTVLLALLRNTPPVFHRILVPREK